MSWINRAESRFGHLAIPGLPRIVVAFNALVFILIKLNPTFLYQLTLNPELVKHGEVWRLISYIFIPSLGGWLPDWLGTAFYLLFLWFVGNGLEEAMGSFKLTWFYFMGMIGVTVAAFLLGGSGFFSNSILNASMFFAFARFYPEVVIYVFFILPMKVKWLAWISAAGFFYSFLLGGWELRLAMIIALSNFFLFFGSGMVADARHRGEVTVRRRRFEKDVHSADEEPMHRCAVCGRTELNAPQLEFRVSKDGNEYCIDHLPKAGAPPIPPAPPSLTA